MTRTLKIQTKYGKIEAQEGDPFYYVNRDAVGIEPVDVESQARSVAGYCADEIKKLRKANSELLQALEFQIEATYQMVDNKHNCPLAIRTAQQITEENKVFAYKTKKTLTKHCFTTGEEQYLTDEAESRRYSFVNKCGDKKMAEPLKNLRIALDSIVERESERVERERKCGATLVKNSVLVIANKARSDLQKMIDYHNRLESMNSELIESLDYMIGYSRMNETAQDREKHTVQNIEKVLDKARGRVKTDV